MLPLVGDPWTVHDDARQVVYQARLATRSPALAADPNAHQAQLYVPTLLAALYRGLGAWVDPLTLTKLLPLALSPLLAALVFRVAVRRGGLAGGVLASLLVTLHAWSRWPPQWGAGDAGEWLAVLQAGALAGLDGGRYAAVGALTVLAAHLYPPAFLILAATAGGVVAIEVVAALVARRRSPLAPDATRTRRLRPLAWLIGGVAVGGALLLARAVALDGGEAGRLFTLAEARSMVEFSPRGRSPLFFDDPWRSFSNDRSGLALDHPTLALLAIALLAAVAAARRARRPSRSALVMLGAGIALWLVSREWVFLYQPVRFVVVTLPLVAALGAGANLAAAIERARTPTARATVGAMAAAAIVAFYAPRLYASHVTASPPALYEALRATPPDALIAGPPLTLDFVPPFAERRVVVSDEMMPPMFVRRYDTVRTLMSEMLTAYTAADAGDVDRFCAARGVSHWVVDLDDFDPRATWSYFPPFDAIVNAARRRGPPYALAEAARGHLVPGSDTLAVVPCPLPGAAPAPRPPAHPPS